MDKISINVSGVQVPPEAEIKYLKSEIKVLKQKLREAEGEISSMIFDMEDADPKSGLLSYDLCIKKYDFISDCGCRVSHTKNDKGVLLRMSIDNLCNQHTEMLKETFKIITNIKIEVSI